jgi:mannan endo-1,6-alpha-mannosidase
VAARLARFTGNSTYYDWAERVWDWTVATALIDDSYRVFDGASVTDNCATVQKLQWTYNSGIYIYGAAMLYNYTNASSVWETRLTGLVEQADQSFFQAYANASGILVEGACEPYGTCNNDMFSFKAYISRFMAKAMVVAPYTTSTIEPLLVSSAQGAAKSCSGPSDGVTCGQKWYVDGFDGSYGVGQQLSALEVTQALLINEAPGLIDHNNIKIRPAPTSSSLVSTVSIGAASVSGISGTSIEPSATTTATATASTIATTSATTFAQESDTTSATESGATSSFTSAMLSASSSALSSAASSAASSASSSAALSTASSGTMSLPTSSAPAKTTSTATATTSANPTSTKNAAAKNTGIARVGALVGGVWIGAAVLL